MRDSQATQVVEGDIIGLRKQIRKAKSAVTLQQWQKLCANIAAALKLDCGYCFISRFKEDETDRNGYFLKSPVTWMGGTELDSQGITSSFHEIKPCLTMRAVSVPSCLSTHKRAHANTGASCLTTSYNSSRWDNRIRVLAGEPEKTHHLDTLTPGHRC